MATQAEKLIRIESPTGARVTVTEADYKNKKMGGLDDQTYADAGYTVVSYEDGTPYEDGAEPTQYAITRTAGEIGEGGSNPTDIDGNKMTAEQLAAAGLTAPEQPQERRTRARVTESAPTPEQPAASS